MTLCTACKVTSTKSLLFYLLYNNHKYIPHVFYHRAACGTDGGAETCTRPLYRLCLPTAFKHSHRATVRNRLTSFLSWDVYQQRNYLHQKGIKWKGAHGRGNNANTEQVIPLLDP